MLRLAPLGFVHPVSPGTWSGAMFLIPTIAFPYQEHENNLIPQGKTFLKKYSMFLDPCSTTHSSREHRDYASAYRYLFDDLATLAE